MSEHRAKEVLSTLRPRRSLGDRIMARVGFRAWERPRVAVSDRIFKLYRLKDPFDPSSAGEDASVGLGPVTLRLGENRRQPAPHAMPKEEKKQATVKVPAAGAPPSGAPTPRAPAPPPRDAADAIGQVGQPFSYIPKTYAPKTPANPPPKPTPPPAPPRPVPPTAAAAKVPPVPVRPGVTPAPAQPPPAAAKPAAQPGRPLGYVPKEYGAKGGAGAPPPRPAAPSAPTQGLFGPRQERPSLVGKLPVRPEARPPEAAPTAAEPAVKQVSVAGGGAAGRRPPLPVPVSAPKGSLTKSGRLSLGAATVVVAEPGSEEPEVIEVVRVSAPRPAEPRAEASLPAEITRVEVGPHEPARPAPVVVDAPRPAPPPRPEVSRRPPAPRGSDGLDDLFAASAQEGRMRIGKAKAVTGVSPGDEPEKPKRAPVALPKPALPPGLPKPKAED